MLAIAGGARTARAGLFASLNPEWSEREPPNLIVPREGLAEGICRGGIVDGMPSTVQQSQRDSRVELATHAHGLPRRSPA